MLAIAILGVVMLPVFSGELERRLTTIDIPEPTRKTLYEQRIKLAGIDIEQVDQSSGIVLNARQEISQAIKESFVAGFRVVMIIAAVMALGGALVTWLVIESKNARAD